MHPATIGGRFARGGRRIAAAARWLGEGALDLLYPWRCLVCGAADHPGRVPGLCPACVSALPWRRDGALAHHALETGRDRFAGVVLAFRFEPPVDDLVYQLKYGGERAAALPLAFALAEAARRARLDSLPAGPPDLVAPVPMHWLKRLTRGFDHARALADELGREWRRPVEPRALRRLRATVAQGQARSAAERSSQVRGAFAARLGRRLRGRHVALVDDVVTSGATASECARALLKSGARAVTLLAVAGNG
jgi:ComF family protein